jgi:hypothetical protein
MGSAVEAVTFQQKIGQFKIPEANGIEEPVVQHGLGRNLHTAAEKATVGDHEGTYRLFQLGVTVHFYPHRCIPIVPKGSQSGQEEGGLAAEPRKPPIVRQFVDNAADAERGDVDKIALRLAAVQVDVTDQAGVDRPRCSFGQAPEGITGRHAYSHAFAEVPAGSEVQNGKFGVRTHQPAVAVEEPVHDFIVGTVSADGQNHIRASRQGVAGEFDGMAGEGRKIEFGRFEQRVGSQGRDQLVETLSASADISSNVDDAGYAEPSGDDHSRISCSASLEESHTVPYNRNAFLP